MCLLTDHVPRMSTMECCMHVSWSTARRCECAYSMYMYMISVDNLHGDNGMHRLAKSLDSMWILFFIMGVIWFPVFIVICKGSKHSQFRRGAYTPRHRFCTRFWIPCVCTCLRKGYGPCTAFCWKSPLREHRHMQCILLYISRLPGTRTSCIFSLVSPRT